MKILLGTAYRVRRTEYFQKHSFFKNAVLRTPYALLILLLTAPFCPALQAAIGEKAMVVTSDPRATQAALEVLKKGGNTIDAAVAAGWVMSVVSPQSSGPGGSGLFLFYDIGTRRILFFDGSVKAPANAKAEMFRDAQGKLLPYQPGRNTGGLPVGVPGFLKLAEEAHAKYGTHKFPFEKLFDPAVLLAEKGTEVSAELAAAIRENADRLGLLDPEKTVFFKKGAPLGAGETLQQPELVKTFRLIQKKGSSAFYRGAIAAAMTRAVRKNKVSAGTLNGRDLENYAAAEREPLHSTYQGYDLFSAGPPADGGVMLFRALNVLSHFGMPGLGNSPEAYHLLGETQKIAFAHREGVADPDMFEVPLKELLSESWAQDRAGAIKLDQVIVSGKTLAKETGTGKKRSGISIMVVDPQGNIAILAASLGDAFGSALRVPGYGFFLNDLLTDFDTEIPAGKDASSAEVMNGGQRPRGPEAPVFFFKEGKPAVIANAYGPEDPDGVLLNVLVPKIDLGVSCSEAANAPRLLTRGDTLRLEKGLYDQGTIRLKLELLRHKIEKEDSLGFTQIVCFDQSSGKIEGESDPRAAGEAAGY
jgi:gamma-glutamyltranspeptidase/glutathione hydrolase